MKAKKKPVDGWVEGPTVEHWSGLWVLGNQACVPTETTMYKRDGGHDITDIQSKHERYGIVFRMQDIPFEMQNLFINLTAAMEANRLALETFLRTVQHKKVKKKAAPKSLA